MGGAGLDYLEGGAGADVLDGGAFFDYAGYSLSDAGVTVNLATGEAEGGHAEGDTLIEIELVWGSSHADRITGNAELNNFIGGAGADTLDGGAGLDTAFYVDSDAGVTVNLATGAAEGGHAEGDTLAGIEGVFGSRHDDHFIGGDDNAQLGGWFGNDTLEGGAGNDRLEGGAGADVIDGGGGDWNFAAYWNSDAGVTVNLATGTGQGGHAEGDTLTNILGVVGSNQADHLIGHDEHNNLQGRDGDDTLEGGAGNDTLEGGLGADMLDGDGGNLDSAAYWSSEAGVTVNLAAGTGQGGEAEGDTLTGIRRIFGSRHADTLTALDDDPATEEAEGSIIHAGDGDDTLQGGTGTDHLDGGAGADVLDGGEGLDYAAYWGSDAGVTINLATGTAQGGHAEGDALMGIERVHGSDHADHLTGDSGDNALHGEAGNDTLEGGAGDDWLRGNAGEDLLTGGEDADTFVFGDGDTVADFQDGSDRIEISDFGHINADNFEANVTIRQSGSNEDTPDPFDFGRGDPFDFGRGDPFDFGRDDPFDFGRDDPFDFGRDDPFDFGRDDPFDFGRGDPVADVEVQIGDAVLTLTGVSAADITVDDFILA